MRNDVATTIHSTSRENWRGRILERGIWKTLAAIKTGVVLLILVVILSAAGTVILQRPATDPDEMQRAYSTPVLRLLDGAGLTDVFHAGGFFLLLGLVAPAFFPGRGGAFRV